jgi:hypothetical protein
VIERLRQKNQQRKA